MNSDNKKCCNCAGKLAYAVAVIGAILIVAFIDHEIKKYTQAPPLEANRAEERSKALAEIHNAEGDALNNTGWIDPAKGVVRLRVEDSIQLMEREWQNPAEGRAKLLDRVAKANPAPPPPPPAKPSQFE
jgi:hypothetical protein